MWYEWFFDGIGTEIISLIIGIVIGGISGYKIGIKNKGIQNQKAKGAAQQNQELEIELIDSTKEGGKVEDNLRQFQKAGNKAQQSQIGKIKQGGK